MESLLWLKSAAQQANKENPHALHKLAKIYKKPPLVMLGPAVGGGTYNSTDGKNASSVSGGSAVGGLQISYLVQ